jgi:hypothetical protein
MKNKNGPPLWFSIKIFRFLPKRSFFASKTTKFLHFFVEKLEKITLVCKFSKSPYVFAQNFNKFSKM